MLPSCGIVLTLLAILQLATAASPHDFAGHANLVRRQADQQAGQGTNSSQRPHKFLNSRTQKFAVDGASLPDVDFDMGESYAGLLPISGRFNESRELFFWFWPSVAPDPKKEIVIWLNGGPGCSSLLGLISENGPFTWMDGTYKPVQNSYDWRNLTNVLWVEQPVGVGFTQGNVSIKNEKQLADQFLGFYEQFIKTFGVQDWDVYLTGESYAGAYIPWIGAEILSRNSTYSLKGVAFNNPLLSDSATVQSITIKDAYLAHQHLYGYNTTTIVNVTTKHIDCEYDKYLAKYFTFPPPQEAFPVLPTPFSQRPQIERCDTYSVMAYATRFLNPCFNIYRMTDSCPSRWSVREPGASTDAGSTIYFNRTDVQKAIHAPAGTHWAECAETPVFVTNSSNAVAGDRSLPVAQTDVLQRVIEGTNNVIIGSGNLDAQLNTNGTILSLQNITWNGFQGFKKYPNTNPFFVPYHPEYNTGSQAGAGVVGSWHCERGLTFYQVRFSGHMLPGDAPGAIYRVLEKLLGRIDNLSQTGTFTTQTYGEGNWTGGFLYNEDEGVPPQDPYEIEELVREKLNAGNSSQQRLRH